MNMLILCPLDTLKQGQRWWVVGIKDLWGLFFEEDKKQSMTESKDVILKRKWEVVFVILSKLDLSFVGKLVAQGKPKKKEESTCIFQFFFLLLLLFPQSQDGILKRISTLLKAALHIKPIQKQTVLVDVRRGDGGALFLHPAESRFDAEARQSLGTTSRAGSRQDLGKLLCQLRFFRWRTWRRCGPFTYGGYQLFIKN